MGSRIRDTKRICTALSYPTLTGFEPKMYIWHSEIVQSVGFNELISATETVWNFQGAVYLGVLLKLC